MVLHYWLTISGIFPFYTYISNTINKATCIYGPINSQLPLLSQKNCLRAHTYGITVNAKELLGFRSENRVSALWRILLETLFKPELNVQWGSSDRGRVVRSCNQYHRLYPSHSSIWRTVVLQCWFISLKIYTSRTSYTILAQSLSDSMSLSLSATYRLDRQKWFASFTLRPLHPRECFEWFECSAWSW